MGPKCQFCECDHAETGPCPWSEGQSADETETKDEAPFVMDEEAMRQELLRI